MKLSSTLIVLPCLLVGVAAIAKEDSAAKTKNVIKSHGTSAGRACYQSLQARTRQQNVINGFLPSVVIDGETRATSVNKRLDHFHVPAMSVAIIHNGQLDWTAAWGHLYPGGSATKCDTLFQAGSIAKPVTVLAALRMKEQGLLDWDKNIETYLTSYHLPAGKQTEQNPVTLRNLFAHTAGITAGGYLGYEYGKLLPSDQQTVRAEAPSNSRKVEVVAAPSSSLRYSGGGYSVAEIALQDHFKTPFDEVMQKWVFLPLGLRASNFMQPLPAELHEHTARGHDERGNVIPGGWHTHPEQAAAGLWATANELAEILIELRRAYRGESQFLSQSSVRELLANPIENHAYGFRLISEGDQTFIVHYGGTVGYNAGMAINLESGAGAVYLINSLSGSYVGQEFFASVSRQYGWTIFREENVKRAPIDAKQLQSFAGFYEFTEQNWKVNLVYENEALAIVFPNGDRYAMTPIEGDAFSFVHQDSGVRARLIASVGDMQLELYGQTGKRANAAP